MNPNCSAENYSALLKHLFSALAVCALQTTPVSAEPSPAIEIQGKVMRVVDGDTLDFLSVTGQRIRVRLAGIDAPEMAMPYGALAKTTLSQLVATRDVTVRATKRDRYGRRVAMVITNEGDVSLALIKQGLAWHYKRYAHEQTSGDSSAYARKESEARLKRVGLWQDERPVAPWQYRQCRKKSSACSATEAN